MKRTEFRIGQKKETIANGKDLVGKFSKIKKKKKNERKN